MLAAFATAASLVLVAALIEVSAPQSGAGHDPVAGVDASDDRTYVPLEGITVDDSPHDAGAFPATDSEGKPIQPEPWPGAQPTPWRLPDWLPQEPYPAPAGPMTDSGTGSARPDGTPTPDGGTAPDAATNAPGSEEPAAGPPDPDPAPGGAPAEPGATDPAPTPTGPDGTAGGGIPTTPESPGADPGSGAVDPGATPDEGTADGTETSPPADVIEGIVPPPAELLPPPDTSPRSPNSESDQKNHPRPGVTPGGPPADKLRE
jgi:hypothetical protein